MRVFVSIVLVALFAACDTSPLHGGDTPFVYATEGTDMAIDLIQAPSGDLIVVGSTEGVPRPADGTLALPSVLRFGLDGDLLSAEVFRDVDFGDVGAVTWARDGLVLTLSAGPDGEGDRTVGVFRADERGRRKATLLGFRDGYLPRGALASPSSNSVTAAVYASASDPQIYHLNTDGDVLWTTRLEGAQDVFGLMEAPAGDVYAYGPGGASVEGWIVARLNGQTGDERWRRVLPASRITGVTQTGDGLAILEERFVDGGGAEVLVARVTAGGEDAGRQVIARTEDPEAPQPRGSVIAALPGNRLAVGLTELAGWETAPEASLVVLAADGTEQQRERFGVEGRWVEMSAIERLADGRIAVAGSVGPDRVGGFGGDDFDIWVSLYSID